MTEEFPANLIVPGHARATALVLDEPLSLWGGLDPTDGRIIEARHPQHGLRVSEQILVMAHGRGSSSASSVLVEAARLGTGPAGFILRNPDEILALGALVAAELYNLELPIAVLDPHSYAHIATGSALTIERTSVRHTAVHQGPDSPSRQV